MSMNTYPNNPGRRLLYAVIMVDRSRLCEQVGRGSKWRKIARDENSIRDSAGSQFLLFECEERVSCLILLFATRLLNMSRVREQYPSIDIHPSIQHPSID